MLNDSELIDDAPKKLRHIQVKLCAGLEVDQVDRPLGQPGLFIRPFRGQRNEHVPDYADPVFQKKYVRWKTV
jgi:hypothetical protein